MWKKFKFLAKEAFNDFVDWVTDFSDAWGVLIICFVLVGWLVWVAGLVVEDNKGKPSYDELVTENAELKEQIAEMAEQQTTIKYVEVVEVQMVEPEPEPEPVVESAVQQDIHEQAGAMYNIDPNILRAIERHETGNYTSSVYKMYNNTYGGQIPTPQGRYFLRYNSPDESTMALAKLLRNMYYNQGMTTLETIQPVYCPNGEPPGPNNSWVRSVSAIYWEEVSEHGTY